MTTPIPHSDYRMQFGLLVADIEEVTKIGPLTRDQARALETDLVPRLQHIRDLDKQNQRGQLDHEIRAARHLFRHIMGPTWRPNPDSEVTRQLAARGIHRD